MCCWINSEIEFTEFERWWWFLEKVTQNFLLDSWKAAKVNRQRSSFSTFLHLFDEPSFLHYFCFVIDLFFNELFLNLLFKGEDLNEFSLCKIFRSYFISVLFSFETFQPFLQIQLLRRSWRSSFSPTELEQRLTQSWLQFESSWHSTLLDWAYQHDLTFLPKEQIFYSI